MPCFRSHSIAALVSPPHSDSAFLHSIIGSPVLSRRLLTSAAVIAAIVVSPCHSDFCFFNRMPIAVHACDRFFKSNGCPCCNRTAHSRVFIQKVLQMWAASQAKEDPWRVWWWQEQKLRQFRFAADAAMLAWPAGHRLCLHLPPRLGNVWNARLCLPGWHRQDGQPPTQSIGSNRRCRESAGR